MPTLMERVHMGLPFVAGISLVVAVILQGASQGIPDEKNQDKINLQIAGKFFREFALATGVVLCVKHGLSNNDAALPAAVIATILVLVFFNITDHVTILNLAQGKDK